MNLDSGRMGRALVVVGALLLAGTSVATGQLDPPLSPTGPADGDGPVQELTGVRSAVVRIISERVFAKPGLGSVDEAATGSGFFVSPDGLVVSANHVVAGADFVTIYRSGDPTPIPVEIIASSECFDLAVLDSGLSETPYLAWRTIPWDVGTHVYAAGYPDGDPRFTLSDGIVARELGPSASAWASIDKELEHTAPIRPGTSGGPLVDDSGAVMGVDYAGTDSGRYLAIAAPEAAGVVSRLVSGEPVASIGLNGEALDPSSGESGIFVRSVARGSPAADAGVRPGDVVTSVGGREVGTDGTTAAYCEAVRSLSASGATPITVLRDGERWRGQIGGAPLTAAPGTPSTSPPPQVGVSGVGLVAPYPAISPFITQDSGGRLYLAYAVERQGQQPGIYLATNRSGQWRTERLTTKVDRDPYVAIDSRNRVHIVFERAQTRKPKHSQGIFYLTNAGGTWKVTRLTTGDDTHAALRIPDGHIHLAFIRGGREATVWYGEGRPGTVRLRRLGYGNPCCQVSIRVDDRNAEHVVWATGHSLVYATNKSGHWRNRGWPPEDAFDFIASPFMIVEPSGVPAVVFVIGDDVAYARIPRPNVRVLEYDRLGGSGLAGAPRLTLAPNGQPVVVWSGGHGPKPGVFVARKTKSGWRVRRLTKDPGDYAPSLTVTNDGLAHVVWSSPGSGVWHQAVKP